MARLGKRERLARRLLLAEQRKATERYSLAQIQAGRFQARFLDGRKTTGTMWSAVELHALHHDDLFRRVTMADGSSRTILLNGNQAIREDGQALHEAERKETRKRPTREPARANLPDERPNLSGRDLRHEDDLRIHRAWVNYPS